MLTSTCACNRFLNMFNTFKKVFLLYFFKERKMFRGYHGIKQIKISEIESFPIVLIPMYNIFGFDCCGSFGP